MVKPTIFFSHDSVRLTESTVLAQQIRKSITNPLMTPFSPALLLSLCWNPTLQGSAFAVTHKNKKKEIKISLGDLEFYLVFWKWWSAPPTPPERKPQYEKYFVIKYFWWTKINQWLKHQGPDLLKVRVCVNTRTNKQKKIVQFFLHEHFGAKARAVFMQAEWFSTSSLKVTSATCGLVQPNSRFFFKIYLQKSVSA